jgi:hypothetical protein
LTYLLYSLKVKIVNNKKDHSAMSISKALQSVRVGQPQQHQNMKVYPLLASNGHQRAYCTLDKAIADSTLAITEMSEGGNVPTLAVRNAGSLPVLLVSGETLVGAKQNRVLNTSLLVPANAEMPIPVSCVEKGRWSYNSREFGSSNATAHFALRKMQNENTTASLREWSTQPAEQRSDVTAAYDAKQGEVWQEISRKIKSHGAQSSTSALHDMYAQSQDQINGYMNAFNAPAEAHGFLVEINGQVVGADLFDHADTLQELWAKLVRGYVIDAYERRAQTPKSQEQPATFLAQASEAKEELFETVGLGNDIRLATPQVSGSGLFWEQNLIHISLFNSNA